VGTVVHFQHRSNEATAKTEAILTRIGELYQQKVKAKEELPKVLAQLVEAGATDLALRAVRLWGTGEMEPYDILTMVETMAAVEGVKCVGDRPFSLEAD
jgi:hypothetical protein